MVDLTAVKERIDTVVDDHAEVLLAASHDIHAHPELGFGEHHAHDVLTGLLADAGLTVERGAYDMETAFVARAGTGDGPTVAVLCEYDALPGIGHACGHNIIGTAGVGAGIAAAAVAQELGGRLVVLGSPAEEGGGGKIFLAERGAFDGVDAAMVHPAGMDLARFGAIAIQQVEVTYHGRAAHAAAAPSAGRNALDAAVLGYMNVAALRQHIRPDERIHGIFTEAGEAPNVVPDRTAATWYVRSPTVRGLAKLKERVMTCLEAGAAAAGCTMDHTWIDPAFADMVDNGPMIERYRTNLARTGRTLVDPDDLAAIVGSTDMGNVSHIVASIHPMIAVSPPSVAIHTKDFVRYARGAEGDLAVLDGAKAMAATVADLWAEPGAIDEVQAAFAEARDSGRATGRATI